MEKKVIETVANLGPHSVDSEESLVACLLAGDGESRRAAMGRAMGAGLLPEMFWSVRMGLWFGEMVRLFEQGMDCDELLLLERLRACDPKLDTGDYEDISRVADRAATSLQFGFFLKIVMGHWRQRSVVRLSKRIQEIASRPGDAFNEVRRGLQSPLTEIARLCTIEGEKAAQERVREFIKEREEELAGNLVRVPAERRLYLGLPGVESNFGAIDRGSPDNNIVVAAPSSRGKSTLMRGMVNINLKRHSDWMVAYFTLEGSLRDYLHQSACAASGLPNRIALNDYLREQEAQGADAGKKASGVIKSYFDWLKFLEEQVDQRLFVLENDSEIGEIEGRCFELEARLGRLDMVVVDYLQIVGSTLKNVNREQQVSEVSGRLKRLQKRLGCPLISGSQLSEEGKARESRAIFNDATRFWKLLRPPEDGNGNDQTGLRKQYLQTIEQQKYRNGATGFAKVNFNVETGRFWEFALIPEDKRGRPKKVTAEGAMQF